MEISIIAVLEFGIIGKKVTGKKNTTVILHAQCLEWKGKVYFKLLACGFMKSVKLIDCCRLYLMTNTGKRSHPAVGIPFGFSQVKQA